MALSYDEKDRIGLALHLTHQEYNKITKSWEFTLPDNYQISNEAVLKCRYVALSLDGRWGAIGKISTWRMSMNGDGGRSAELSMISRNVRKLDIEINSNITSTKWLNGFQLEAVEAALADETSVTRPETIPACLNMEEASEALARRYGVDAEQIQISIHRKNIYPPN